MPTPEREGYEFLGWNVAPDYGPNGADNYGVTNVDTYVRRVFPLSWWTNSTFQVGQSIYIDVSWNTGTLNQVDVNDLVLTSDQYIVSGNRCYMYYDITSSKNINSYSFVDFSFSSSSTTLTVNYFVIYTPSTDYVTSSTKVNTEYNHFLLANWVKNNVHVAFNANGGSMNDCVSFEGVTNVSGTSNYGFSLNADGYYESGNAGVQNSYSLARVDFTAPAGSTVNFKVISYGENNYDYGIFSNLNTTLTASYTADTTNVYKSFKGLSSADEQKVTYNITTTGSYYIYIKYRKDSSINSYDDSLKFFMYTKSLRTGGSYGTLPTPTRLGYTFQGWYTAETGGTKIISSSTVTLSSNHVLYAQWQEKTWRVTKSVNGSNTAVSVREYMLWDPGEVSNIASDVKLNGWKSNTSNIEIYTDLIYQYYNGVNCGKIADHANLSPQTNSVISVPVNLSSSDDFTMVCTAYFPIRGTAFSLNSKLSIYTSNDSLYVEAHGNTVLTINLPLSGFHTLAVTYDNSLELLSIYINGSLIATATVDIILSTTDSLILYPGSSSDNRVINNAFIIKEIVDVSQLGASYAAKVETGNFLALVKGSGTITANYAVTIPTGSTLTYNTTSQTGVASSAGYSRSGTYSATNAGDYSATVSLSESYFSWSDGTTGNKSISWSIAKRNVSDCDITLSQTSYTYDGTAKKPTVTVKIGSVVVPSENYTVTYSNNTNAGTATVTITATSSGNLTGSDTVQFTINRKTINVPTPSGSLVYNGSVQTGVSSGTGYTRSGTYEATNAGTYTATVILTSNYMWSDGSTSAKNISWSIAKRSLSNCDILLSQTSYTYDGKPKQPDVTVKIGNNVISADNYSVDYSNNINVGTATVTITATSSGNLTGSDTAQFTIGRGSIPVPDVADLVYNGKTQTGVPAGTGYTRSGTYEATNAGTYTATVILTSNYMWSDGSTSAKNISWSIAKRSLSNCDILLSQTSYTYDGKPKQPDVTVKIGNNVISADNYSVDYSNNINVGTATVTITATSSGNLTGSDTAQFTIGRGSIPVPDVADLVYNGKTQTGVPAGTGYTRSGTYEAKDAGSYTAKLTPTGNYQWSDGSTAVKTIDWSIAKYGLDISELSIEWTGEVSYEVVVDGVNGEKVTLTITPYSTDVGDYEYSTTPGPGKYTVKLSSNNYAIAEAGHIDIVPKEIEYIKMNYDGEYDGKSHSISVTVIRPTSGATITYSTSENGTYTTTNPGFINAGVYKVYFKITAKNYISVSDYAMVYIDKYIVEIPQGSGSLVYNVALQTGVAPGDGYTRSGTYEAVNAGTYEAIVSLVDTTNYIWSDGTSDPKTITWSIAKRPLSECEISLSSSGYDMSGSAYKYEAGEIRPVVTVRIRNNTVPSVNYSVSYSNNINVGTATVTITATDSGNLSGSTSKSFTIAKRPLSECDIILSTSGYDMSGSAYKYEAGEIRPVVTVRIKNNTVPIENYTVTYSNNINVGTATVTVTATDGGNLSGSTSENFTIVKRPLSECNISLSASGYDMSGDSYKYIAGTIKPAVVVRINNNIVPASNYTVTYSNNVNVGTATVTITATDSGNLSGSASRTFTIVKRPLSECEISLSTSGYDMSGSSYKYQVTAITPTVIVKIGNNIVPASNYTVTYSNNVNAGTANISITATTNGNLSGNRSVSFTIAKRPVGECSVTISQTSFIFTGQEIRPDVTVRIHGNVVPESNYTVEYSNNINVGKGSLWIVATPTGNLINGTGGGGNVIEFEIETREYNIIIQENGGSETEDMVYSVSATNQAITLPTLTFGNCTFEGYTIVTNTLGGTSSITNKTTLNIPANAYGDITVKANWSVEVTIEIVGNKSENTLTISDGKNNLTTGINAVAEGSKITISTTLTANADASEYQLLSIYKDDELLTTVSSLLDTEYTTTLSEAITKACTIKLEYKDGKRLEVNTEQGVTSDIEISGTSDGDVYATEAENTITITIDTSSLSTVSETYIGFTYEINGEIYSSYNTGDGIVEQAGSTGNVYKYTISGESEVTNIDVIIRQSQNVTLNTDVEGYNSLSLTSEDGFTRQLDRSTSTYSLYVGIWEINVDLATSAEITEVLDNVFGVGNYTVENGRYYYTITAA